PTSILIYNERPKKIANAKTEDTPTQITSEQLDIFNSLTTDGMRSNSHHHHHDNLPGNATDSDTGTDIPDSTTLKMSGRTKRKIRDTLSAYYILRKKYDIKGQMTF